MNRDIPKHLSNGNAVEKRIRNAILTLRQSKSDQERRSARKILLKDSYLTSKVRHEMFVEFFNSVIDGTITELFYTEDQPLKTDDVAYLVVREMLWRLAEESGVEAAQAIVEGALEVVELNFGCGEEGRNYLTDADFAY